jgi:Tol biopolymer transport system component
MRLFLLAAAAAASLAGGAVGTSSETGPVVSPDGRYVLFVRAAGSRYDLDYTPWIVSAAGGGLRRMGPTSESVITVGWTPAGLASISGDGVTRLVRPDGTEVDETAAPDPSWSPDGMRFAYARHGRLWIATTSAGVPGVPVATAEWFAGLTWSPDSRRLAYVRALPGGRAALAVRESSGTRLVFAAQAVGSPSWSPGGRRLAFMGQRGGRRFSPPHVFVADLATAGVSKLGSWDGSNPAWAPRGDWIAAVLMTPDRAGDVWSLVLVRPDGRNMRTLGRLRGPTELSWFPEGSRIAFTQAAFCRSGGVFAVRVRAGISIGQRLDGRCR